MATKFVFNPFTGTFDIVQPTSWDELACGIPDYISTGRPIVLDIGGSLKTADMVLTGAGCRIEDLSGSTIYAGTPYIP